MASAVIDGPWLRGDSEQSAPAGDPRDAPRDATAAALARARAAQRFWAGTPTAERLRVVRRLRPILAARVELFAAAVPRVERAETIAAEVLPLADACRFLTRRARRLLAPRRAPRAGRAPWLSGTAITVRREPWGVVLMIGPANYPLLLPGVQALQALAAGNAAVVKPAPGGREAMLALARALGDAGLAPGLFTVLGETEDEARSAIRAGVDHVVLTGAADTGRAVLADLAPSLTPATLELSGCDAAFVRRDADLALTADALAFGLAWNGSATCIAPRRALVDRRLAPALERALAERLEDAPDRPLGAGVAERVGALLEDARGKGARVMVGGPPRDGRMAPTVLADATPQMAVAGADVFAPILAVIPVTDDTQALAADAACPYALGATVFGAREGARALAEKVDAGVVVIDDMIVPTADPRVPFGGRGTSGFGTTRGAEGLLAMTRPKAVIARRGRQRRHFTPLGPAAERLFGDLVRLTHGHPTSRLGALKRLLAAAVGGAMRSGGKRT